MLLLPEEAAVTLLVSWTLVTDATGAGILDCRSFVDFLPLPFLPLRFLLFGLFDVVVADGVPLLACCCCAGGVLGVAFAVVSAADLGVGVPLVGVAVLVALFLLELTLLLLFLFAVDVAVLV